MALAAAGRIQQVDGQASVRTGLTRTRKSMDSMRTRLDRLSPPVRELLLAASVPGQRLIWPAHPW
jgi:hypothetical protein